MTRANRRNNPRRTRNRPRLSVPNIVVIEDTALATIDTASTLTIYSPPQTTTSLELPSTFRLRSAKYSLLSGATAARVFAIFRRVPAGYTAPAITVATGVTTFVDVPDVIGYGLINYSGGADPENMVELTILKPNIRVFPGDTIVSQIVPNASSVGLTYTLLAEFNISAM